MFKYKVSCYSLKEQRYKIHYTNNIGLAEYIREKMIKKDKLSPGFLPMIFEWDGDAYERIV